MAADRPGNAEVVVFVCAPILGSDASWVAAIDPRVTVIDGNGPEQGRGLPLERAEVAVLGYPVPSGLAARAPGLRWVHHTQAGVSNLHASDLWDSPAVLTSGRGFVAPTAIAEYVLAAAFHFASGLDTALRQKHAGEFARGAYKTTRLAGATMGVVGAGGIGREVARLARAAGMRVVATRRSVASPQRGVEGIDLLLPPDRLRELAAEADYLAVCAPLTAQTRGLIGADVFAVMKANAILVNIARGELLDESALIAAVTGGMIRGAVLDVYAGEGAGTPPRRELVELEQIVLTPHISAAADRAWLPGGRELFAENLRRYLDGGELVNLVDRERGY